MVVDVTITANGFDKQNDVFSIMRSLWYRYTSHAERDGSIHLIVCYNSNSNTCLSAFQQLYSHILYCTPMMYLCASQVAIFDRFYPNLKQTFASAKAISSAKRIQ